MNFALTVDTSDLDRKLADAVSQAEQRTQHLETVIRDAVLDRVIEYTPPAPARDVASRQSELRDWGWHDTGYVPKTPFTGRMRNGKKLYYYQNRYPNQLWSQIQAQRKARMQRKLNEIRSTRRTWRKVGSNEIVGYERYWRQAEAALHRAIAAVSADLGNPGGVKIDIRF